MTAVITTKDMCTGYAGQPVVHDLNIEVNSGEVVCLLGPNGAGKTTTMLALAGELPLISGEVLFDGVVTTAPLHKRAQNGMSYVTEERSVFKGISCRDNLRVAGVDPDGAVQLFPELAQRMSVRGGLLSGGEQQMLAVARALARLPRLMLLDELSLGLAPVIVESLLPVVRRFAQERGCAVVLVEQHVHLALEVADRGYVLSHGQIVLHDQAERLRADRQLLIASYLGEHTHTASAATSADGAERQGEP
jgi:branched-chain amino acid transport system ATP-binding protein